MDDDDKLTVPADVAPDALTSIAEVLSNYSGIWYSLLVIGAIIFATSGVKWLLRKIVGAVPADMRGPFPGIVEAVIEITPVLLALLVIHGLGEHIAERIPFLVGMLEWERYVFITPVFGGGAILSYKLWRGWKLDEFFKGQFKGLIARFTRVEPAPTGSQPGLVEDE